MLKVSTFYLEKQKSFILKKMMEFTVHIFSEGLGENPLYTFI